MAYAPEFGPAIGLVGSITWLTADARRTQSIKQSGAMPVADESLVASHWSLDGSGPTTGSVFPGQRYEAPPDTEQAGDW